MKIVVSALPLQTAEGYLKAGVSRYCYNLLQEFANDPRGNDYTAFTQAGVSLPSKWQNTLNIKTASLKRWRKKTLWDMFAASVWARRLKPDIWFSTAHAIPVLPVTTRALMVHDLLPLHFPELFKGSYAKSVSLALKFSIKRAEILLANSEDTKRDIISMFNVPARKVHVTPLGPGNVVAPKKPEEVPESDIQRLGIRFARYVLTLSSIGPRKNIPRLVHAMSILTSKPEYADIGLVIGGAAEYKAGEVNDAVIQHKMQGHVLFPGYIPDSALPSLFARAELFVYPSLNEGFGLPVLEAMLLGAPCCTSARGALTEVGGDAALYFDPEQPQDIAACMHEVLRSEEMRSQMVSRGFEQAKNFTWQRTASATLAAFREVPA